MKEIEEALDMAELMLHPENQPPQWSQDEALRVVRAGRDALQGKDLFVEEMMEWVFSFRCARHQSTLRNGMRRIKERVEQLERERLGLLRIVDAAVAHQMVGNALMGVQWTFSYENDAMQAIALLLVAKEEAAKTLRVAVREYREGEKQ